MEQIKAPTPLLVVAVLGVLFGVMGLCGGVFGLFALVAGTAMMAGAAALGGGDGIVALIGTALTWVQTLLGFPVTLALLAGSVGALVGKPWSKKVLMAWAVASVLLSLLSFLAIGFTLGPQLIAAMADGEAAGAAGVLGSGIGGICGMACSLIFPAIMVYVLRLEEVQRAYETWESQG